MIEPRNTNWDVYIPSLNKILVYILIVVATVMTCTRRKRLQRRCFAWFYGRYVVPGLERELKSRKVRLFGDLKTTVSRDPALVVQGPGVIRLLEIGIGTGINLEFYPTGCRLITVEPNQHFAKYFDKNRERFGHIVLEKSVSGSAEDMSEIPDSSVDVVVSTYVLCSVDNLQGILNEIVRVLVPGGKFYYLEHVSFKESTWSRTLQCLVEPIWSFFSDDCKLTSKTSEAISKAGFTTVNEDRQIVDGLMYVMRPHIIGIATK